MRRRAVTESGVATLSAVTVAVALIGMAVVLLQVGLVLATKHRVQAGADLAALAGSEAAVRGRDACHAARSVARHNEVSLTACRVQLAVVTVRTASRPGRTWGIRWQARAKARAAPSYYVDGLP